MSAHDYTPEQTLDLLMRKLRRADEHLANEIQEAIDAGKDVEEKEPPRGRRKKPRVYRKTAPYSYEEALQVALDVLQAHFIEQPLFANSCSVNLAAAAIGIPKRPKLAGFGTTGQDEDVELKNEGEEKAVVIEMRTETQISGTGEEVFDFKTVTDAEIEEQKYNLARLKEMFDFS